MNVAAQLQMFEPEGAEALSLLQRYLKEADHHLAMSDRMELLGMHGAMHRADLLSLQACDSAFVLAVLLDLERESGL